MNITSNEFASYLVVQTSGLFNMFSNEAIVTTGLGREKYFLILKNYKQLVEKYREDENCKDLLERLGY